jgi:hypothetical protein
LVVGVEVVAENGGTYNLNARLMDPNGNEIVWAASVVVLDAGIAEVVDLNFDGPTIYSHGVNGPYTLQDVYIYDTSHTSISDYAFAPYTTKYYSYFEFGNHPPYDFDNDGDVDIVDIMKVASRWNSSTGDPNYDATYDVDKDGDIDIVDVMKVAAAWTG